MLAIFSGVDTFSVTIIVAAFMGGLGFGSMAGGYMADRLTNFGRLLLFGIAELTICIFALVSKVLYYDLLYLRFNHLAQSPVSMTVVLFLSLIVPTFLMGVTLPLLSRALTSKIDEAAGTVGALYGFNTLGAAVGSFVTGWFLVRAFGFETSLYIGASLSFFCAAGALAIARYVKADAIPSGSLPSDMEVGAETVITGTPFFSFPAWAAIYALSGFIALSLEILWFRVMGVMLKSTSFTFSSLLAIYLAGLALGTITGIRLTKRSRSPVRTFFVLQAGITVYAALSFSVFIHFLGNMNLLDGLWGYFAEQDTIYLDKVFSALGNYFSGSESISPAAEGLIVNFILLYFIVPALFIGPSTFLMGLSFTFLHKAVQTDRMVLGRRVGWLQTANIIGSMAGAFVVGWVFLRILGSSGTFRLLIILGGIYLVLWTYVSFSNRTSFRVLGYSGSICLILVIYFLVPSPPVLWSKLHGSELKRITFAEDDTGLTVIKQENPAHVNGLYINGFLQSWFPYGRAHTFLGLIPAMMHQDPREVAVIGLGSGDTLFSIAGRSEVEEVTCFELLIHQRGLLERFNDEYRYNALKAVLKDERIRLIMADGRASLKREDKKYDIIEADIAKPHNAYAGNLFSYEYFKLARERLKPGGLVVSWVASIRTIQTFVKVFPYGVLLDYVIVGSNEPVNFDVEEIRKRLQDPYTREYYRRGGFDLYKLETELLSIKPKVFTPDVDRSVFTDINTDLYPRDEYWVPRQ